MYACFLWAYGNGSNLDAIIIFLILFTIHAPLAEFIIVRSGLNMVFQNKILLSLLVQTDNMMTI